MKRDIEKLIHDLNLLASGDGELWQYEGLASSMVQLAEQKRSEFLSSNPAAEIMTRLFSESDSRKRSLLAETLRQETLKKLHDLRWTLSMNNDRDIEKLQPVGESLVQVYKMLNLCAGEETLDLDEKEIEPMRVSYDYDKDVQCKFMQLNYDVNFLVNTLVRSRYISKEDAALAVDIMEGVDLPYEKGIRLNWKGTVRSLVTFVVLGYEFGIVNVEWKKKRQKNANITQNSPNFESSIINTFMCRNKDLSTGISRDYVKPISSSTPQFREFMKGFMPDKVKGDKAQIDESEKEIDLSIADSYLSDKFPDLDVGIMQVFAELLRQDATNL
jgi:hypothetical protein